MNLRQRPSSSKVLFLAFVFSVCAAAQDGTPKVLQAAAQDSPLEHDLRVLTDEIGGRVPGTPAMEKAIGWCVAAFKKAGADSVHTEGYTIPTRWAEGNTQVSIIAPVAF